MDQSLPGLAALTTTSARDGSSWKDQSLLKDVCNLIQFAHLDFCRTFASPSLSSGSASGLVTSSARHLWLQLDIWWSVTCFIPKRNSPWKEQTPRRLCLTCTLRTCRSSPSTSGIWLRPDWIIQRFGKKKMNHFQISLSLSLNIYIYILRYTKLKCKHTCIYVYIYIYTYGTMYIHVWYTIPIPYCKYIYFGRNRWVFWVSVSLDPSKNLCNLDSRLRHQNVFFWPRGNVGKHGEQCNLCIDKRFLLGYM